MSQTIQKPLDPNSFLEILSSKEKVLFAFDYDGTLTGFKADHNGAILTDKEVNILNELAKKENTKVAIITGRALDNLKFLLQGREGKEIMLYGTHGGEIDGREAEAHRQENYQNHIKKIRAAFEDEPHIVFEDKPLSITVHYKTHPDVDDLVSRLHKEAEKHSELFRVQTGHNVFEFLPKDINKGMAIEDLNKNHPDYFLIFLGDDLTDNYGFKVINQIGGLSIQVGERMKERVAGYLINSVSSTYELIHSYMNQ